YFKTQDLWPTWFGPTGPDPLSRAQLGGSGTTTVSYAAFADLTYELTPKWFFTAGARYSRDEVQDSFYNNTAFAVAPLVPYSRVDAPDLNDDHITPRFVLRYEPTDTSSIYASYTRGYKAGIIDVGGGNTHHVQPEDIEAYEVGYKFDNHA